MKTMKEALAAKSQMKAILREIGIAAACGVTKTTKGALAVKVNLTSETDRGRVPVELSGLEVVTEVVGQVKAARSEMVAHF